MTRVSWTLDPYVNISDQHYKTFFAQDFMLWDSKLNGSNIQKMRSFLDGDKYYSIAYQRLNYWKNIDIIFPWKL
jgi:hypothetical protein